MEIDHLDVLDKEKITKAVSAWNPVLSEAITDPRKIRQDPHSSLYCRDEDVLVGMREPGTVIDAILAIETQFGRGETGVKQPLGEHVQLKILSGKVGKGETRSVATDSGALMVPDYTEHIPAKQREEEMLNSVDDIVNELADGIFSHLQSVMNQVHTELGLDMNSYWNIVKKLLRILHPSLLGDAFLHRFLSACRSLEHDGIVIDFNERPLMRRSDVSSFMPEKHFQDCYGDVTWLAILERRLQKLLLHKIRDELHCVSKIFPIRQEHSHFFAVEVSLRKVDPARILLNLGIRLSNNKDMEGLSIPVIIHHRGIAIVRAGVELA